MKAIRVLIVPSAEGQADVIRDCWIVPEYEQINHLVGGYIEGISGYYPVPFTGYCNEEGKIKGLPVNSRATTLWYYGNGGPLDDVLVGDVVFMGPPDEEGNETDVPKEVIELALSLFGPTRVKLEPKAPGLE